MKSLRFSLKLVVLLAILSSTALLVQAQATRTWVASNAGGGDDANPCSRTSPCLTFAGAISKTAGGGEIDVIEPGAYGAVTIDKAITIDGGTGAGWASIITTLGTTAITVNCTGDQKNVILRNLTLNGARQAAGAGGAVGISLLKAGQVHIENVTIENFETSAINIDGADTIKVWMQHVTLIRSVTGVQASAAAGSSASIYMDDVSMQGSTDGLNLVANAAAVIRNSFFGANVGTSNGAVKASSGCTALIENSMFASNGIAVNAASGGTVTISNNSFYGNTTALSGGGTIATATNTNKFFANGSDGATNATITLK
ncbi:MAG TPA: hypothetical protein VE969_00595 [Pyrinomonadaceae bacterium]|nr:hypothetical protein [Pyrinomonadaceae bacterium]